MRERRVELRWSEIRARGADIYFQRYMQRGREGTRTHTRGSAFAAAGYCVAGINNASSESGRRN